MSYSPITIWAAPVCINDCDLGHSVTEAQDSIGEELFKHLILSEQYSAAAYCIANTLPSNLNVSCFSGNCKDVEISGATILAPSKCDYNFKSWLEISND
jgi:hypothetical protein